MGIFNLLGVGELEELSGGGEDDKRKLGIAEHGQLIRLLQEAVAALGECDLPAGRVLDATDLNFTAARRLAVTMTMTMTMTMAPAGGTAGGHVICTHGGQHGEVTGR